MFGVGMGEVVLILLIALVVYGPDRLPGIARKLGRVVREFKRMSADVQKSIEQELNETEMNSSIKSSLPSIRKIAEDLKEEIKKE